MNDIESSGIRRMFELSSQMKNPVNLSLGLPHFDVPEPVKKAASEAIWKGKNQYSITKGIPELRDGINLHLTENEKIHVDDILIVSGASGGLVLALLALVDPGSDVLIPDPYFVAYPNMVKLAGGNPVYIDTYPHFKLTPEKLRNAKTERSKVLIFNSPGNPSGVTYHPKEIETLAFTAKELGLQVISDEVYDIFTYEIPFTSWLKYDPSALMVRAFSKTWRMTGWRVGFAAGPQEILDAMTTLQQFSFVCVHTPSQYACIEALKTEIRSAVKNYQGKRDFVYEALKEKYEVEFPSGAFFLFPKAPGGDLDSFIKKCLAEEVLVIPGDTFSQRKTHFRISYALEEKPLRMGVKKLLKIADELG